MSKKQPLKIQRIKKLALNIEQEFNVKCYRVQKKPIILFFTKPDKGIEVKCRNFANDVSADLLFYEDIDVSFDFSGNFNG